MTYLRNTIGIIVFCLFASVAHATPYQLTQRFDGERLDLSGQLMSLKYNPESNTIELDDRVLIEDDAPGNGPPEGVGDRAWFEKLHRGVMIKKEFILDDPNVYGGCIVMNGTEAEENEEPLHLSLNGHTFTRLPTKYAYPRAVHLYQIGEHNYFTDNWFIIELPVGALRPGTNELLMWAESDSTSWEVKIAAEEEFKRGSTTRTHHPDQSGKSTDGGRTWDNRRLGWKNEIDGEYAIRISLDRFASTGTYISPVIDLADSCRDAIKKLTQITQNSLAWDIDCPAGTDAVVSYRIGTAPLPDVDDVWQPYAVLDGYALTLDRPRGRYLQFKVDLSTENPLLTPSLNGCTIDTEAEMAASSSNVVCHVAAFDNAYIVRSSMTFTHEDFRKLNDFRERFELDELLEGASTEFEKQIRLLRFAYRIPIEPMKGYVWDFNALPILKKDENGNIYYQEEYTGRRRDLHCLMSNFTLMGACLSMGYPARYVNLQTDGRQHAHEVIEVWSNDFSKWVLLDATRDYYIYDPDTGIPLSLVEICERLREIVPNGIADWYDPIWMQIPDESEGYQVNIAFREGDNNYSIRDVAQGPHLLMLMGQLHMVVRNDFASRPGLVPWRIASGHWGGNQYYGYYNETFPRKREYEHNTNRWQDFNFSLNQSALTLAETSQPGVFEVSIDTVTPQFDRFVIQIDNTDILEISDPSFEWTTHEGKNILVVRARNNVGVLGPESRIVVNMNN